MSKLYVGSLAWSTIESELADLFEQFGPVVKTTIIRDRETSRSRGFGYVQFDNEASAQQAQQELNGYELHGHKIKVNIAPEQAPLAHHGN
ncbi:hypothetical protein IWQ62_005524 [Dispira parvispora]|uniref:RRM domain-containing protein n=1 Tax=Dispira parvispora TaxID=1520584 RepID=A0A9W8AJV2_9FUNG|nr:hypothetical protein IWQ62_005524 [Dispira parvispora]